MADLEFYAIGCNPEEEAERTQLLYLNSGVDTFVRDEFEVTVQAYTSLPIVEIAQRLRRRYAGDQPLVHGVLAVYDDADIGMAIWGEKNFHNVGSKQETPGINVSAWILRQYRGQGLGRRVIQHVATEALALSEVLGKQVWTSIKQENLASRQSCEHAGFVEVGPQPYKPGRLLYILPAS